MARYGGEEFVVILTETDDAEFIANICRQSIEELQIKHEYSDAAEVVTISVGFCSVIPQNETNARRVIRCADKALYEAKNLGRNRVMKNSEKV